MRCSTPVPSSLIHREDDAHVAVSESLAPYRGLLLTTEAVLTESMHLLGRARGGQEACLGFFIRGVATGGQRGGPLRSSARRRPAPNRRGVRVFRS